MSINKNNYEEWMVAFVDGELTVEEQTAFNRFMEKHPSLKEELAAYGSTQFLADEEVVYTNKELLHKKEGAFVLLKKAWPYAAMLFIALTVYVFVTPEKEVDLALNEKSITPDKKQLTVEKETSTYDTVRIVKEQKETPIIDRRKPKPSERMLSKRTPSKNRNVSPFKKEEKQVYKVPEIRKPLDIQVMVENKVDKPSIPEVNTPIQEKEVIVQGKLDPLPRTKEKTTLPSLNSRKAVLVINEKNHPVIHQKFNDVVSKVENKIEIIKELKKAPITVSIGKLKLFTLNN